MMADTESGAAAGQFQHQVSQIGAEELKETLITQQMQSMKANQRVFELEEEEADSTELALGFPGDGLDRDGTVIYSGPGAGGKRKLVWVPIGAIPDPDPRREGRRVALWRWTRHPKNSGCVSEAARLIDCELEENFLWALEEAGDLAAVALDHKVRICASYRLIEWPAGFSLVVCTVDAVGGINMLHFLDTDWTITFEQLMAKLDNCVPLTTDSHNAAAIYAHQQKRLRLIEELSGDRCIQRQAKALKKDLAWDRRDVVVNAAAPTTPINDVSQEDDSLTEDSGWLYCIEDARPMDKSDGEAGEKVKEADETGAGDAHDTCPLTTVPTRPRAWSPLASAETLRLVIERVKREEPPASLVVIRVCHERLYTTWKKISEMEQEQEQPMPDDPVLWGEEAQTSGT